MKHLISLILAAILLLSMMGCQKQEPETTAGQKMDVSGKYELDTQRNEAILNDFGTVTTANSGNGRVYYQIFVGSFSDSNGDGCGDLRGIINRFDYLNDGDDNSGLSLGVEGIWLSPIFMSPSYHKYDASSYYRIDPKFGTEEDLKELIELCHSRNVQIILDLVINHTATSHVWFQNFKEAHRNFDSTNQYYNYYSWSGDTNGTGTWAQIPNSTHYYECNFSTQMPELNYDNEAVRQEMVDVAKYYLELGVDGFRFDAAKYIYFGDEERNVRFWDWYMAELRAIKPDIYTVAEVWSGDAETYPYFSSTNCFNFSTSQVGGRIADTARSGNVNTYVNYVATYIEAIRTYNPNAMMVPFLANHDTDRAAGYLTVASGSAKVAANLLLLMPGSPFIYYGEEIGLLGSRGGANTDANRRLAMLWGDGDTVRNPEGTTYSAEQVNGTVKDQLPDGNSLYNHYKKLIGLRKAYPEIAYGELTPLKGTGKLGGYLCTWNGSTVAVVHNTTDETVTIDLVKLTDVPLQTLLAGVGVGSAKLEGTVLTLEGQTSAILR